ncbi:MAG: hypothetical protein IKJ13_07680 [Clostridia bacterium]|nr:hypothetical protein [Clostridia bacterium]
MIIYYKQNNGTASGLTRVEQAVMFAIENESDIQKTKHTVCNAVFNIEGPRKFGEGLGLEVSDEPAEDSGLQKCAENVQFMKEFVIPAQMFDEYDLTDLWLIEQRAKFFIQAYYKALNKICEAALMNGEKTEMYFNGEKQDISLPGGESLFSDAHRWGKEGEICGEQSNYFRGSFFDSDEEFENAFKKLCDKLKEIKAEDGVPLGYVADTIIIPCNQSKLHEMVLRMCCNDGFRHFVIVVMPNWYTERPRLMIMSSEANKELSGNMFFNRVPLVVSNWVDSHTGNYIWNGRCRFGVGFGSYKHILLAVDSKEETDGATPIE